MKKWVYWMIMFLVSILHGLFFYLNLISEFKYIEEEEIYLNIIGYMTGYFVLPIFAGWVLISLNVFTLIFGIKLREGKTIRFINPFHMAGLTKKAKTGRIVFIAISVLLICFAAKFSVNRILSVCYALSGGLLLYLLYIWLRISPQNEFDSGMEG